MFYGRFASSQAVSVFADRVATSFLHLSTLQSVSLHIIAPRFISIRSNETDCWTIAEWHKSTDRTLFLESEASKRFVRAVQEGNLRQTQLVRLPRGGSCSFHPGNPDLTYDFREVLTAYFPENLPDAMTQALDRIKGPFTMGGPMSGYDFKRPFDWIHEGLLGYIHGWADETVNYRGQPARRMICMLKWFDELAQRQYKEEARWPKRRHDGRTIVLAMDAFLDDLEDLGMLGYETRNVECLEVYKYYWPGDPGYDSYVSSLDDLNKHPA